MNGGSQNTGNRKKLLLRIAPMASAALVAFPACSSSSADLGDVNGTESTSEDSGPVGLGPFDSGNGSDAGVMGVVANDAGANSDGSVVGLGPADAGNFKDVLMGVVGVDAGANSDGGPTDAGNLEDVLGIAPIDGGN